MIVQITKSALFQEVADRIRDMIYLDELRPGSRINEKDLSERFGISRTPLREALKVLCSEGLVDLIPRRGSRVRALDPAELDDLFPVMAVLEGLCARQAVVRADDAQLAQLRAMHENLERLAQSKDVNAYYDENFRFHEAIQTYSGNPWLKRVTSDLRTILRLARHHQLTVPGRLAQSLAEHREIMLAFEQRDEEMADQAMRTHLLSQRKAFGCLAKGDEYVA